MSHDVGVDRELVRRVVELATRAPSVHNTQPWRFVAGPATLDVHADRGRQLTVLDPTGRQLMLSCGAAVGTARAAVRAFGYGCSVDLLPTEGDIDHLARLTIGGPQAPSEDDVRLGREISHRRTVRDRFDPAPLTPAAHTVLDHEAEAAGTWLQWVDSEEHRTALAVLSDRADRIERADPAIRAELARWRHPDDGATDGITTAALPLLPPSVRASDVPLRDFALAGADPGDVDRQRLPLPPERPDVAVLCTRYDGPTSWLQAGEATTRLLLRATTLGVATSPLGQVLDLPWTRRRLRAELGTIGHPQLVLRLGHARIDGPRSPRRAVEDVLTGP